MASVPSSSRLILTDLILQISELSRNNPTLPPEPDADEPAPNPLKTLPKEAREIIVALDYLMPSVVTSALDVLDKGLVTRYCVKLEEKVAKKAEGEAEEKVKAEAEEKAEAPPIEREIPGTPTGSGSEISDINEDDEMEDAEPQDLSAPAPQKSKYSYYVESEKIPRSRFSKRPPSGPTYKVLLSAWYCTCPKFFASFAKKPTPVATNLYPEPNDSNKQRRRRWEAKEFERVWDLLRTHNWVWGGRMLGVHAPPICKHLMACVLAENCGELFVPFVKRVELDVDEMVGMVDNILRL